jgi:hypothetical protein
VKFTQNTSREIGGEGFDEAAGLFGGDLLQSSGDGGVVDSLRDVVLHGLKGHAAVDDDIGMQELGSGTFLIGHADVAAKLEGGEVDLIVHGEEFKAACLDGGIRR